MASYLVKHRNNFTFFTRSMAIDVSAVIVLGELGKTTV
jgi:hypothetical protein